MSEEHNDRFKVVAVAFVLVFVLIILQLINIQIFKGEEYEKLSQNRVFRDKTVVALRGNIFDRNEMPIAKNRIGYDIQIARTGLETKSLNAMLLKLCNILELNNEHYEQNLSEYLTINPFEYGDKIVSSQEKINKWKDEMVLDTSHIEKLENPERVYEYFRDEKFNIGPQYTLEEAYKIMTLRYEMIIKGYSSISPLTLARDISLETVAQIEERYAEFPGILIDSMPIREYVNGVYQGHVLGYLGSLTAEQYNELKNKGYRMNDMIGKSGIEAFAEEYLRGTDGERRMEFDNNGRMIKGQYSSPAIPGDDVILTIDSKLQKVATESLEKRIELIKQQANNVNNFGDAFAGSVVAIDVKNGEVLVMANYPSYDPKVYVASSYDEEAQRQKLELLTDNKTTPMLNRAIQGLYAPGSTFKPLTAIAALEEKVITPNEIIYDNGTTVIGGWTFYCLDFRSGHPPHGALDLKRAMATSCNIYFHEVGFETGIDNIYKWA